MLAVRTPEAPQATCTLARPAIPPSPLRDRVGHSDHDRFRGYFPLYSGLQPPCLRFAVAVTGHHARLGSRLLARLYRGRHLRRQTSTRLQGATRTRSCRYKLSCMQTAKRAASDIGKPYEKLNRVDGGISANRITNARAINDQ